MKSRKKIILERKWTAMPVAACLSRVVDDPKVWMQELTKMAEDVMFDIRIPARRYDHETKKLSSNVIVFYVACIDVHFQVLPFRKRDDEHGSRL